MNPSVHLKLEENGSYRFQLSGVNVSIANAIRRTILSDIKVVVFDADACQFENNKSRLHNEILKERLKCIPVFVKDVEKFPEKYHVTVDVKNESENIIYVTSKDFKIIKNETGEKISEEERDKIFPKNIMTGFYIDFMRLNPWISETLEKEQIKFKCNFTVKTSKENGSYSVVSKCSYQNTIDKEKVAQVWREKEELLRADLGENISEEKIQFERRDFLNLDAERYFIPNSFDFVVDTIGVYTNQEIVSKACILLQNSFYDFSKELETEQNIIQKSSMMTEHNSTIENSFDIVLDNKDYTFGKVLEFILYDKFFLGDKNILSYCAFHKFHPHDTYSVVRIAFFNKVDMEDVRSKLIEASNIASQIFTEIYKQVK